MRARVPAFARSRRASRQSQRCSMRGGRTALLRAAWTRRRRRRGSDAQRSPRSHRPAGRECSRPAARSRSLVSPGSEGSAPATHSRRSALLTRASRRADGLRGNERTGSRRRHGHQRADSARESARSSRRERGRRRRAAQVGELPAPGRRQGRGAASRRPAAGRRSPEGARQGSAARRIRRPSCSRSCARRAVGRGSRKEVGVSRRAARQEIETRRAGRPGSGGSSAAKPIRR